MRNAAFITSKILTAAEAKRKIAQWKLIGKKIAFTNGCFDILHRGHVFSLSQAAAEADFLIVGLNSDASTRRLKGEERPINDEQSRALLLAAMVMVDAVVLFEEDTPLELIKLLEPDVLVKGGDYTVEQIAGASEVIQKGGKVVINPIVEGFSTTGIVGKIKVQS
jgi:D-beta-D-heptose 7-phosphate kinase/D-beta-D-heptose 1-phosphate adenosyltransferase